MSLVWIFILFLGVISAWYLGFYTHQEDIDTRKFQLPKDYLLGLNFLLNEEPDKAVDVFIKMLEVDSDTVETHLAVGKLFRKRGEVDRAIRIHQNLIARPQLPINFRDQSLFELGQDYYSAGMLDRAERIFLEVAEIKSYTIPALRVLLEIYQQEKLWENAIQTAKRLESATKKSMQHAVAHYHCELAHIAQKKGQHEKAHEWLEHALNSDPKCVRASLLQAKLEMNTQNHKAALKSLKRIKNQNPDYLSESITSLVTCYEALNEEEKLVSYLMQIVREYPHVPIVLILADRICKWKGNKTAIKFVANYVKRYPTLNGLHLFIDLYLSGSEDTGRDDLLILRGLTKKLLKNKPDYQCSSCGFAGKTLHWQCPGCKQWDSVKPVYMLESKTCLSYLG